MHLLSPVTAHAITLLFTSTLLGGARGFERERHERPAGLRTHILVCVSSTLLTIVSCQAPNGADRIAAQIVTDVGFLGAGTILRDAAGSVRGLTTAASLWMVAAIGIAVGYGSPYTEYAIATTVFALLILIFLGKLEWYMGRTRVRQEVTLLVGEGPEQLKSIGHIFEAIRDKGAKVREINSSELCGGQLVRLTLAVPSSLPREDLDELFERDENIVHHEWAD